MPSADNRRRATRVSSAAMASTRASTSAARLVMSLRLPMGVPTMYRPGDSARAGLAAGLLARGASLGSSALRLTRIPLARRHGADLGRTHAAGRTLAMLALAVAGFAAALSGCQARNYHSFGSRSASRPATQAP